MWKKIYYYLGDDNNFTSYYHCHEDGEIIPCPNFSDDEKEVKCKCGKYFKHGYTETIEIQEYWHKEVLCGKYLIHHDLTSIQHIHTDGTSHSACLNKSKRYECCDCQAVFDETIDPTKYQKKKLPVNGEIKYYLLKNADLWIHNKEEDKYFFLDNGKEEIFEAIKASDEQGDLICPTNGREKDESDLIFTIEYSAEITDIFSQVQALRKKLEQDADKKDKNSTQPLQFGFAEIFINLKEQEEDKNIPSIPKKPKREKRKKSSSTTPWQGEKINSLQEKNSSEKTDEKDETYICPSEEDVEVETDDTEDDGIENGHTIKTDVISLDENLEEINDEEEKTSDNTTDDQIEESDKSGINEKVLAKNVAKLAKEDLKVSLMVVNKRIEKKLDQASNHINNYSLSVMDDLENSAEKTVKNIAEHKNSALKDILEKEKSIAKEQEMSQKAFSEHLQEQSKKLQKNHKENLKAYEEKIAQVKPEIAKANRTTARRLLKIISALTIISILTPLVLYFLLYKGYTKKEQHWQKEYQQWLTDVQKVERQQKTVQHKWQRIINNAKHLDKYLQARQKEFQQSYNKIKKDLNSKMKEFQVNLKTAKKVGQLNQQEKLKLRNEIQDLENQYKDLLEKQNLYQQVAEKKWDKIKQKLKKCKIDNHQPSKVKHHLQALNKELKVLKQQYKVIAKEINQVFTISKELQKPPMKKAVKKTQSKSKKAVKPAKNNTLTLEVRDENGKILQRKKY